MQNISTNLMKSTKSLKLEAKYGRFKSPQFNIDSKTTETKYTYNETAPDFDEEDIPILPYCSSNIVTPSDGTLIIEIKDNGCGIKEEEQKNLFKPFSQANNEIYSKFKGTGLGLWITERLITAMKGYVFCSSSLGKGSTFHIKIPAKCKGEKEYVIEI